MDEAANVVMEVVLLEAAVIVTDPTRVAAMTAARTVEFVETMVLVPTMTWGDLGDRQ